MLKEDGSIFKNIVRVKDDYAEVLTSEYFSQHNVKFLPVIEKRRISTKPITSMSLTYNGIANGNIILNHMTYYLGSNNSGNFQTINIPNKPGNVIVGGAKLRILNANNQKIEFMILQEPTL